MKVVYWLMMILGMLVAIYGIYAMALTDGNDFGWAALLVGGLSWAWGLARLTSKSTNKK